MHVRVRQSPRESVQNFGEIPGEQIFRQKIVPGTTVDLGQSGVGLGIRSDAAKPDIGSAEGLKRALLAAKSIVITDPATGGVSGAHIAEMFQRLRIAEELKPKLKLNRGGPNAAFVARGEADIRIQLAPRDPCCAWNRLHPATDGVSEDIRLFGWCRPARQGVRPRKGTAAVPFGTRGHGVIRAKGMDPVASK